MPKLMVVKRNGEVVDFDQNRIRNAILKAVKACGQTLSDQVLDEIVLLICQEVEERFVEFFPNVENIQDIVEKNLVKKGLYEIAKEYILYRNKRQKDRDEQKKQNIEKSLLGKLTIRKRDGRIALFDIKKVRACISRASKGFEQDIDVDLISKELVKNIYDGVTTDEIDKALVLATIAFIERDSAYSFVGARLFLQRLYKEAMGKSISNDVFGMEYREAFIQGIKKGVECGLLDKRMLLFDLDRLSYGLAIERDNFFEYLGVQVLYERYFLKVDNVRFELPQGFWMRVAMGLAINEPKNNERALEFYEAMSKFLFTPSTPTLFHAGSMHPQLSSCYLTTVTDDLKHIFKCVGDNAQLSKWSGGIANDWTNIRSTGAYIKSTNVESQGVVPFLKIANDTTAAINRSGKRRGATCAYLEAWHLDIEDFVDLRKNTGDERRRTHDMDTANWIPDLFMKRVLNDEEWTLFSPDEVPDLHHIYGKKFEKRYVEYEEKAKKGQIKKFKTLSAVKLWRKMLGMLFETGHPWITFKDPCNIRSPQDHCGVVHSSNLCTEITLNTSEDETAVCNLGSINLGVHVIGGRLDKELLAKTVKTAVRMLDNVIDINFYPTIEAQNSNMKHRPIGLGIMAFQDALFKLDFGFEASSALEFADNSMEFISYHAILASSELAKERGSYQSYNGSKWDRNIFPVDTLALLEEERGMKIPVAREERMEWHVVRSHVKQFGMRNSNVMAVAPTATISNIVGCFPCIEPIYKNIYVKANMSGEFTVVNSYLVDDLKKLNLWSKEMLDQIKYYDGNLQLIPLVPQNLKEKYREAFEIDPLTAINITAARGKWIDQSQSHNVFINGVSGKKLSDVYIHAWKCGLKTTYYLRTLAASQIEKSTLDASKFGFTQKREYKPVAEAVVAETVQKLVDPVQVSFAPVKACRIADPDCEACQ
ncbi:ribonucleoside-diphosphate reductase subunit alpha [Candidatus Woesearchaeota archaeon]|nr:ribonucleoside-diphosphate reductase subunit alpha [Candidatus Woesearchaeota archaeon]